MSGPEKENAPRRETGGAPEGDRRHHVPGEKVAEIGAGGDHGELLTFLRGWSESGPWWPAAMKPDKAPVVQTFTDLRDLIDWLAPRIGRENLYFHVNDLSPGVAKMAEKADVTRIRAIHVDIDPRPIEGGPKGRAPEELAAHYEAEHARILRLATDQPNEGEAGWPKGLVRPTAIVDSGGGCQCFWLFAEGEDVPHDLAHGINRAVAALVGGDDDVANVNRIMRLPGAVNVLNKVKRERGRAPAPTRLVWADWSRRFRVADFPPPVVAAEGRSAGPVNIDLPADLPSLDDLPATVSDRTKRLIVMGTDPDDPNKYPSRSEALWAAMCEMVRAGCTDDQIAAVILDPDYGISGHVLDQPKPHQYAARQVARAREEAVDPELAELNAAHVVILSEGPKGKCRVMQRLPSSFGREVIAFQSFDDFRNAYMNRTKVVGRDRDGNEITMPLGKWWLQTRHRRQHRTLTFLPGGADVLEGDQLNLWSGFGIRPKPGDWSKMRAHITEVLAGGDAASADYIIKWAAFAVQHPDKPAEAALVFRGELGTGKGMFGRAMLRIFGRHGVRTQGANVLDSRFNAHLRDCCLLFADEVDWDSRRSSAQLKGMVTEESLFIEPKGVDATNQPNYLHIIIASNNDWVIPAAPGERRFAVFGVPSHRKKDQAYWEALQAEADGGGLAAMLHDLLSMDLTGWHPRWNIPQTAELSEQKLAGLSGADAIVREMLMGGLAPGVERPAHDAERVVMVRPLIRWAIENRIVSTDPGEKRMGEAIKKMGVERRRLTIPGQGQRWAWPLPPLAEARAKWADNLGVSVAWPDDGDWTEFPG